MCWLILRSLCHLDACGEGQKVWKLCTVYVYEGRAKPPKRKFIQTYDVCGALCILCCFHQVGARKRKGELKYIRLYVGDSTRVPWSAARLIMWDIQDRLTNSYVQYKTYKYTSSFIFCCGPCMHGSCLRPPVVKRKGKRKFLVRFHGLPLSQKLLLLIILWLLNTTSFLTPVTTTTTTTTATTTTIILTTNSIPGRMFLASKCNFGNQIEI